MDGARAGGVLRGKATVLGSVLAALLATVLLASKPAHAAATFTVNQTSDTTDSNPGDGACDTSGLIGSQCTLRAAIQEANAATGADAIQFNIGGAVGVKTIAPISALPVITDAVTIDGYTQPGASPNTNATGFSTNAVLMVELSGADAGDTDGLFFSRNTSTGTTSAGSVVRGLAINRFEQSGISGGEAGTKVEGNFVGTDPSGEVDLGNGTVGVGLKSGGTLGGTTPEARNVISGNRIPITLNGSSNKVQGNLIGTAKDGISDLGNTFGMSINGLNNTVGGNEPGAANAIAHNGGYGVYLTDFNALSGNRILSNSIFSNDGLGIDLDGDGPTPNDPRDPDTGGANNLQNYPVLSSASGSSETTVTGTLNSRPRKSFTVQFFASPEADPSGFGEGQTFLGQKTVRTSRKGKASFTFTTNGDLSGQAVTATATNNATGDTSEFSAAVTAN